MRSERFLLIGAGPGLFDKIRALGWDPVTVDIDPARNPDHIWDLCGSNSSASAIRSRALLRSEHVFSPVLAVRNLQRALKPGGTCLITTPFLFE